MRLPRKVRIGPHVFRVRSGKGAAQELQSMSAVGACFAKHSEILVDGHQSMSQQADTLLHEILHACYDQTPLRSGGDEPSADEEAVVSALAPLLLGVLRENPELVKVLVGGR